MKLRVLLAGVFVQVVLAWMLVIVWDFYPRVACALAVTGLLCGTLWLRWSLGIERRKGGP